MARQALSAPSTNFLDRMDMGVMHVRNGMILPVVFALASVTSDFLGDNVAGPLVRILF
jgi:hypothetical protein